MSTVKRQIQELLDELPEDCTIEDVQHRLYLLQSFRNGLQSAETEPTYTQEEIEAEFAAWLDTLEDIEAGKRSAETEPTLTHEEVGVRLSKWLKR